MTLSGWLFDAYTLGDRMVFWIITEAGTAVRLEDAWTHSIYVAADNESDLKAIARQDEIAKFIKKSAVVSRYETLTARKPSNVLKITLKDSRKAEALANNIWQMGPFGQFRLYNVDLLPAQAYFYENDLFPLAFCRVNGTKTGLKWQIVDDDIWSTNYRLPDFRSARLDIRLNKTGRLPKFSDKIKDITIKTNEETLRIDGQSEAEILHSLVSEIGRLDPDFIFVDDGDAFGFPHLIERAEQNSIDLMINREQVKLARPSYVGTSYSSYGKIHFKPAAIALLGRVHLDSENSFVWNESGMHGFYEVARICRMPLHTAFRASIGKCLSSLQFYHATKDGRLVPWKPVEAEHFKTLEDLLLADRGGLILVPRIGVHEKVAEFDFASLFPNIMLKKNVSAETISCDCCPDSDRKVPQLNFHICKKRTGIVPTALEIVIKKRAEYKRLKKASKDEKSRAVYDSRQNALKWINVTSFGYLGFNNAKFGRIDSHQAVCAFDRETLLTAVKTAEGQGYRILHGIVDSLWVQKKGATTADYLRLKAMIEEATGFEISFEGEYKWIAFLPSKSRDWQPVPNRYFGAFSDGSLKIRGIEARRHDTPPLFARFQLEVLDLMANGNSIAEVKALMPEVQNTFHKYEKMLESKQVSLEELVISKAISKDVGQYQERNTVETEAIAQLAQEGKSLKAGQALRYVVTSHDGRLGPKSVPIELISDGTEYDTQWYISKMAEVANSVTEPFGYRVNLQRSGRTLNDY